MKPTDGQSARRDLESQRGVLFARLGKAFYEQYQSDAPDLDSLGPLLEEIRRVQEQLAMVAETDGVEPIPPCRCGWPLRPGARFCGVCGTPVAVAAVKAESLVALWEEKPAEAESFVTLWEEKSDSPRDGKTTPIPSIRIAPTVADHDSLPEVSPSSLVELESVPGLLETTAEDKKPARDPQRSQTRDPKRTPER